MHSVKMSFKKVQLTKPNFKVLPKVHSWICLRYTIPMANFIPTQPAWLSSGKNMYKWENAQNLWKHCVMDKQISKIVDSLIVNNIPNCENSNDFALSLTRILPTTTYARLLPSRLLASLAKKAQIELKNKYIYAKSLIFFSNTYLDILYKLYEAFNFLNLTNLD